MLAPTAPMMTAPMPEYGLDEPFTAHRRFKKHKALPRPRQEGLDTSRPPAIDYDLVIDTATPVVHMTGSQPSSPRTLKHESRRIGSGPDLPPTPPNHSRNSSTGHSALPSSPTINESSFVHTPPRNAAQRSIATPPDQRSPPTPDVTPPGPASRPRPALRPSALDRSFSRTTDSRTESFKTAREDPLSSEDEGGQSTVRPTLGSATTSRTTILQITDAKPGKAVQPQALDMALERLQDSPIDVYTPRTKGEFGRFDGDWGTKSDVEQEWDDNLQRVVTVKKRPRDTRASRSPRHDARHDVVDDDVVTPTNATKAVRQMPLREAAVANSSPTRNAGRKREPQGPSTSGASVRTDPRRSSGHSTRSNPSSSSAVVEAILIDAPPQRQRTLRHVQKRTSLREPEGAQTRPNSKRITQQQPDGPSHGKQLPDRGRRLESHSSHMTSNSVSSGRARREVWKSGGIPVVVVPDRRSSSKPKSSKEPSLRSTSSRRSKRTLSVDSASQDRSPVKDVTVGRNQPSLRGRSRPVSESDPLDQRTIDFPPVIPARSSSLSAPTSRNASRAGSLTAESLRALNKFHQTPSTAQGESVARGPQLEPSPMPDMDMLSPTSNHRFDKGDCHDLLSLGKPDDGGSSKRYSSRNTPFSIASFETTGTAPELSEAMAIHMYPHQNSSVVMVNHSAKPSEASDSTNKEVVAQEPSDLPKITATSPDGGLATPPQQRESMDEVDSPLRNPRPPPQPPKHPPAINFIPATPSGLTPADERLVQLGNFYEATGDQPPRRPSLVRRAFSRRRRHSIDYPPTTSKAPGFLTRTFSLSRNTRQSSRAASMSEDPDATPVYPQEDDKPSDEDKLHPYWRPQWPVDDGYECDGSCDHHGHDHDEIYRYPLVDNRPQLPARTLSAKMKRTFAIFPNREEEFYLADSSDGPERRTIKRTPSGNLRVMRRRSSGESLRRRESMFSRAWPRSRETPKRPFWRPGSLRHRASKENVRRASISSRLEGIQNLPRLLSERRREKRTQELRQMISGPKEVRDGVDEVIKPMSARNRQYDSNAMP